MTRPVFLVGSVPFHDTEEVFRRCGDLVGMVAKRLPDGERGGWLPGDDFRRARGLVEGHGKSLLDPPVKKTVRLADGVSVDDLAFETLHYYPNAMASYGIFSRLRREGVIPAHLRFQVSIPTAFTGSIYFDHDQVRTLWPAYEKALLREVGRIVDAIPHEDLGISWDVVEFGISLANPDPREVFSFTELADALARAVEVVPAGVECGFHFCYGGHNSNGMPREGLNHRELNDTGLMVRFFNAVRASTRRRINWLHVPVPRSHDGKAYFAPLADLHRDPETELYLGLLYLNDGIERTRRKIAAAQEAAGEFGVGAACGLNPFVSGIAAERVLETLAYHRTVAEIT